MKNSVSEKEFIRAVNAVRQYCRDSKSCQKCPAMEPIGQTEICQLNVVPYEWPVFEAEEENRKQIELVEG